MQQHRLVVPKAVAELGYPVYPEVAHVRTGEVAGVAQHVYPILLTAWLLPGHRVKQVCEYQELVWQIPVVSVLAVDYRLVEDEPANVGIGALLLGLKRRKCHEIAEHLPLRLLDVVPGLGVFVRLGRYIARLSCHLEYVILEEPGILQLVEIALPNHLHLVLGAAHLAEVPTMLQVVVHALLSKAEGLADALCTDHDAELALASRLSAESGLPVVISPLPSRHRSCHLSFLCRPP